jgi:hypothetical protein
MAPVKTKELGGLRTGQKEDHVERKENLDCYRKKTKMKRKNKKNTQQLREHFFGFGHTRKLKKQEKKKRRRLHFSSFKASVVPGDQFKVAARLPMIIPNLKLQLVVRL